MPREYATWDRICYMCVNVLFYINYYLILSISDESGKAHLVKSLVNSFVQKRVFFLFYSVIQIRQLLRLLNSFMQFAMMHSIWIPITRDFSCRFRLGRDRKGCHESCHKFSFLVIINPFLLPFKFWCTCVRERQKRERRLFERWSMFRSLSSGRTHFPSFWFFHFRILRSQFERIRSQRNVKTKWMIARTKNSLLIFQTFLAYCAKYGTVNFCTTLIYLCIFLHMHGYILHTHTCTHI